MTRYTTFQGTPGTHDGVDPPRQGQLWELVERDITKIDTEYLKIQNVRNDGGTARWVVECEVFRGKPGGAPPLKLRRNGTTALDVTVFLNGKYRLIKDAR